MIAQKFTVGAAIFLGLISFSFGVTPCTSNEDCPYGSCNVDSKTCKCDLACKDFSTPHFIRTVEKALTTLCRTVNEACQRQQNIPFKLLSCKDLSKATCKKFADAGQEVQFCEDQSFCGNNGICLMHEAGAIPYCICNKNYSGSRCESRLVTNIPESSVSVVNPPPDSNGSYTSGNVPNMPAKIAPYVALGMLSCMLCCCVVFRNRRRQQNNDVEENENNDKSSSSCQEKNSVVLHSSQIIHNSKQDDVIGKEISMSSKKDSYVELHETAISPRSSVAISIDSVSSVRSKITTSC
ncbi:unnamed protein product [Clavelina lepadiformis]|uniref:EGF-like domain-containing protein n=1 Tax=Clavelina lepadiformis TaxID=159417 RepID=A0ABP0F2N1_CLALP